MATDESLFDGTWTRLQARSRLVDPPWEHPRTLPWDRGKGHTQWPGFPRPFAHPMPSSRASQPLFGPSFYPGP
eukprot:992034-Pyramimonas_sp.AAC.1